METKIIAITGINGNQGGSVATAFLKSLGWTVRGITRSLDNAASKDWSSKGVSMVEADLDNPNDLVVAFRGVHAVFGVTNWWQELGVPANWAKAAQTGIDIRKICFDIEVQRGKNMIDAAATVLEEDGLLEHLVLSVCPDTLGQSGGKIKDNYHFDAKWAWVTFLRNKYTNLEARTSLFQPAIFLTNWDAEGQNPFVKKPDGTIVIRLPVRPNALMPFFHPNSDTGRCINSLISSGPSKNMAAVGSIITWTAVFEHLTREFSSQNIQFKFEQITPAEFEAMVPGPAGPELSAMWQWIDEFGYYGKDESMIYPRDLGIEDKMTTVEKVMTREAWARLVDSAPSVTE